MAFPPDRFNILRNGFKNDPTTPNQPRETDALLVEFLNDQEQRINLTDEVIKRLILLDKRRKSHEQHTTLVYGDRESELTHLEDSFEIVSLVSPEIKRSALVHDIDKTGPANADNKTSEIIMSLFVEIHDFDIQTSTILDLIIKIFNKPEDQQKATEKLREVGINPEMNLNNFYPLHVEWGEQILKNESGLTAREKFIALNHHQMWRQKKVSIEGYEPDEETIKQSQELELADFYQAARSRGGKTSTQAQNLLRKIFVEKIPLDKLNEMIDKIASRDIKKI